MESSVRVHAHVTGTVQGVWFRASTVDEADKIGGLVGWVKNLPDCSVEVMCEGDKDRVDMLLKWLWQGPPSAKVAYVGFEWSSAKGDFSTFEVRY